MRAPLALLAGLALLGSAGAHASVPRADDARVAAAREGLADWLAANKPASPSTSTDLPGCPALDLETFGDALAGVGLDGDLGDWGTEIEWDEYEDIDRNMMGVVCGGDTDGDSHDGSFELAAGVFAVDAGSAERAIDVLSGLGFGALDVVGAAEVPALGVDDGELTSGCLDDDGLHACLAFWSVDGLLLGLMLWSEIQELSAEGSVTVLGTVLPELLDTLAGQRGAQPPAPVIDALGVPAGDGNPVGDARAALGDLLAATADTPESAPLEACTLAGTDVVAAALEAAGVDAPLSGWGQWIGRVAPLEQFDQRGIVCEGVYIGATGDPSFPELSAALAAVDFGDAETLDGYLAEYLGIAPDEESLPTAGAGGATTGRCAERDRIHDCYEVWTDGSGFAVMLHVQDRTFFDRPTASAVLDQMVPVVLASLGAAADGDDAALSGVSEVSIEAAVGGLSALVADPAAGDGVCAALGRPALDAALADAAIALPVDDWTGAPAGDRPGFPPGSYVCTSVPGGGAGDGLSLFVGEFASPGDAGDFIASLALADGGTADDLDPTASSHGSCVRAGGAEFCVEMWQHGSFVIGVTQSGPADDIGRGDAAALLAAAVPDVVSTLAAVAG